MKAELNDRQLVEYIENLLHSCLLIRPVTHTVKQCPNREALVANFLDKYKRGEWAPVTRGYTSEEMEENEKQESKTDKETSKRARLDVPIQASEKGVQEGDASSDE